MKRRKRAKMSYISFWGARGGRTRPKICCMSIYQIGWADCKKPYGTSKNYFQVTLSKSTASFNKKQKSTIEHRKWAKMTYIWFWVYWLAEYAHKSVKYRSTKFGGLTGRDPNERAKAISQLIFLTRRRVLVKTRRALSHSKHWRKWLVFDSGCTGWSAEQAPKSDRYRFTKFSLLIGRNPEEVAKYI